MRDKWIDSLQGKTYFGVHQSWRMKEIYTLMWMILMFENFDSNDESDEDESGNDE
jgi:hypothetical protein